MRIFSLLILVVLFFQGCAYRPVGKGVNFSSVYIAPVKNKIDVAVDYSSISELQKYFPDIDAQIRSKLSGRFVFDGNVKTVNKDKADLILHVELLSYYKTPMRFSEQNEVEGYRISVIANVYGEDRDGKQVYAPKRLTGVADYILTGSNAVSESDAVLSAIDDLVKRIVEYVVEVW